MSAPGQLDGTFTCDVEDYFQVSAFASVIRPTDWDHYDCRVVRNTHRVLDAAAATNTRGTFFVLGWVAERFPELVSEIRNAPIQTRFVPVARVAPVGGARGGSSASCGVLGSCAHANSGEGDHEKETLSSAPDIQNLGQRNVDGSSHDRCHNPDKRDQ